MNDIVILDDVPMPEHRGQIQYGGERRTSVLYDLEVGQCAVFPNKLWKRSQIHGKIANMKKFAGDRVFKSRSLLEAPEGSDPNLFPALVVWRTQ